MKKTLIPILTVVIITTSAFAQEFRVGVIMGLELSNVLSKDNDDTYSHDFKSKAGLKSGVIGEYSFNDFFALASEFAFVQRGVKFEKEEDWSLSSENKMNINYLQIPINAKLSYPIFDDFKVFGFAGTYVAFALSGKVYSKLHGETEIEKDSEKIKFGSNGDLKRFDFGLNFGVGVEYKDFFLKGECNLGLSNISTYTEYGAKLENRNFSISVGYMFSF